MNYNLESLKKLWSITGFSNQDLTVFAQQRLVGEIQQGLKVMSTFLILKAVISFILFICDLDDFKNLNDSFGHEFGDRVLILFSQTILKTAGHNGYLIRIGGDEFILLLVDDAPQPLIMKLESSIRQQVHQEQPAAVFGMSWGLVTLPLQPVSDLESVYQNADKALYVNKQANRKPIKKMIA